MPKPDTAKLLLAVLALATVPLTALGGTYTFTDNTDFDALSHGTAYTWGLSGSTYSSLVNAVKTPGTTITSASLTISNIYDWRIEPADVLYVNVLNNVNQGAHAWTYDSNPSTYDSTFGTNPFATSSGSLAYSPAAANSLLVYSGSYNDTPNPGTWSDPSNNDTSLTRNFNLVLNFSSQNLALLQTYLAGDSNPGTNPTVGLGFGPDCHYFDSGVCLTITTGAATVPDGGSTLLLVGLGCGLLVASYRLRRRDTDRA